MKGMLGSIAFLLVSTLEVTRGQFWSEQPSNITSCVGRNATLTWMYNSSTLHLSAEYKFGDVDVMKSGPDNPLPVPEAGFEDKVEFAGDIQGKNMSFMIKNLSLSDSGIWGLRLVFTEGPLALHNSTYLTVYHEPSDDLDIGIFYGRPTSPFNRTLNCSISHRGEPPVTLQWIYKGQPIPATNETYGYSLLDMEGFGEYKCVAKGLPLYCFNVTELQKTVDIPCENCDSNGGSSTSALSTDAWVGIGLGIFVFLTLLILLVVVMVIKKRPTSDSQVGILTNQKMHIRTV